MAANGLAVFSSMRMLFEEPGVLWQINFTNPTAVSSSSASDFSDSRCLFLCGEFAPAFHLFTACPCVLAGGHHR